jgi:hypothetical protein
LPKIIGRSEERSSKEWAEDLVEKVLEAIAIQRKNGDSISTTNSAKAVLDNTCVGSNQQEENIAEPSSVEKHQSEEAQNPENKEDKKLENHQEVEQDIVQVIQRPYSPNVIDFDNKKILILSYQTESTKEKNIVIDINAAPRMIKNSEVVVSKKNERKKQVASRPKPIVKWLLDKYSHCKDNLGVIRVAELTHMSGSHILQWNWHIGAVHLLFIRGYLLRVLIIGRHTIQGQGFIFNRSMFRRGICLDHTFMRKELSSIRKLGHMMPL